MLRDLPPELRVEIGRFLPIWERWGFKSPPVLLGDPMAYYNRVRVRPRPVRWERPARFYYRRCRQLFKWALFIDYRTNTRDYWVIEMRRQWDSSSRSALLDFLVETTFYTHIHPPPIIRYIRSTKPYVWGERILRLEFEVHRPDGMIPTRQASVDALCQHMIRLAAEAEISFRGRHTPIGDL